eukprot:gnl/TRDRNA2_/TRDRNA2_34537_c0_seq1.p2 gnl/TRDRNA2_/TRDRNA2_34537_c0~~gnl/TRDRNA2_/TRDRNA2_34537_c0_seq1.p2  ORF type:complete len:288 (+),score=50.49 gnl/TRDRNA2_/TRDRNA2_34537_c0_seq1:1013-1876(+)
MFVRLLRLLRLARILRTVRLLRIFKELRIMMEGIACSFMPLFWCFVMIAIILGIFSLIFIQGISSYLHDAGNDIGEEELERIFSHFGSMRNAMFSLFAVTTTGSWEEAYAIVAKTDPTYRVIFIFFVGFYTISVGNIVTGIFVEHVFSNAQPSREELAFDERKALIAEAQDFRQFLYKHDVGNDGKITLEEFRCLMHRPIFAAYLRSVGLDITDAARFFNFISKAINSTDIDIDDFICGCLMMRGAATALDQQVMLMEMKSLSQSNAAFQGYMIEQLQLISKHRSKH